MKLIKNNLISIGLFCIINIFSIISSITIVAHAENVSMVVAIIEIFIYTLAILVIYFFSASLFIGIENGSGKCKFFSCISVLIIQMIYLIILKEQYMGLLFSLLPLYMILINHIPQSFNMEICICVMPWLAMTLGAFVKLKGSFLKLRKP